jgi:hypothetical protein
VLDLTPAVGSTEVPRRTCSRFPQGAPRVLLAGILAGAVLAAQAQGGSFVYVSNLEGRSLSYVANEVNHSISQYDVGAGGVLSQMKPAATHADGQQADLQPRGGGR